MKRTTRIVHISTVHSALDPRIRLKELASVRDAGMEAHFITADPAAEERGDGIRVHRVARRQHRRLSRIFVLGPKAVWRAFRIGPDLYHIHDPELLPWAWLLRLRAVPVVYDVHEDYTLSVGYKHYVLRRLTRFSRAMVAFAERALSRPFYPVIAERCYQARFPHAPAVLNYPSVSLLEAGPSFDPESRRLLYTGNVTIERGALSLAHVSAEAPELEMVLAGKCAPGVAMSIRAVAGEGVCRLRIVGEGRYVPFAEIRSLYAQGNWLAGMALIPDTPHYREKQLTKFFEYMAAGLPIVATDVPAWRRLIVDEGLGFCVDPEDPRAAAEAVRRLRESPREARAMGMRGRELVRRRYNWEGEGRRLVGYYNELVGAL